MKRVLLFVLTLFVLLTGCGGSDGYSVDSSEQERIGETDKIGRASCRERV